MRLAEWPVELGPASPPPHELMRLGGPRVEVPEYPDPGHLATAAEWQAIVERATELELPRVGFGAADAVITAKYHGGLMRGAPTFVTIHDAETPLRDSYARSIAEYFERGPAAGTSAHHMIGPRSWYQLLPENVVAYAAGPKGNTRGIHIEQTGTASLTRAGWTTPDGLAQIERVAQCAREACDTWGIPKRWATDAQLRAAAAGQAGAGGLVTHKQISRVVGGTTHSDPEPNYPGDLLLAAILRGGPVSTIDPADANRLKDFTYDALWSDADRKAGRNPFAYRGELLDAVRDVRERLRPAKRTEPGDRLSDLWNSLGGLHVKVDQQTTELAELRALVEQLVARGAE